MEAASNGFNNYISITNVGMEMSTRDRLCSTIVSDLLAFPHLSFNDYLSQLLIAEKRRAALATQHARNLAFAQENRVRNEAIAKKNHVANVAIDKENQARNNWIAQEIGVMKGGVRAFQTEAVLNHTSLEHVTQLNVGTNPNIPKEDVSTIVGSAYPRLKLLESMTDLDTQLLNLIRSFISFT